VFGVDVRASAGFNLNRLEPLLADLHQRLAPVTIEHLHFSEFIRRYDRPDTLFYLDPPYWGCESDYGAELFDRSQFAALAAQLRQLRGRFILTINDRPEERETFEGFDMREVETTYSLGSAATGKGKRAGELIVQGGNAFALTREGAEGS